MTDDFRTRYINANVSKTAAAYDGEIFAKWVEQLQEVLKMYTPDLAYGIIIVMLCAQRRGDAAGPFFADIIKIEGEERAETVFSIIREAITLAVGFVGLPNTMPANFGLIAQLKQRNIQSVPSNPRPGFHEKDYAQVGAAMRRSIYRGVGNPEVSKMIAQYLPDLSNFSTSSIFGYAIGGCRTIPLKEGELVVVSSIIAMGASRQARSHCKAAMQLGNAPEVLQALDKIAQELAEWNGTPLPERLDVPKLKEELDAELARLEQFGPVG